MLTEQTSVTFIWCLFYMRFVATVCQLEEIPCWVIAQIWDLCCHLQAPVVIAPLEMINSAVWEWTAWPDLSSVCLFFFCLNSKELKNMSPASPQGKNHLLKLMFIYFVLIQKSGSDNLVSLSFIYFDFDHTLVERDWKYHWLFPLGAEDGELRDWDNLWHKSRPANTQPAGHTTLLFCVVFFVFLCVFTCL